MANSTDKSILTAAGKALLAQLNAEEKALVIDKMIFANVPNRPEYPQPDDVVPTDHIVRQEQVEQRGRLSADSVIYSTTLTSDVGPFDFNWTGAYCSEYGVLVTIDHHALTPKTADEPGVAGNTLVRSVVLEYKDIAEITNITVDASSWQYNATERMKKMDSDVAQSIIDQNGKDWFIEDGFLVTPSGSAYSIKAGAGYVSGNRVAMEFDRSVQVPNKPSFIYIDAHREGTPTGEQVTLFNFVVTAEEKDDYIDSSTGKDVKHFVCKIAQVLADGSVSDLRPEEKNEKVAVLHDKYNSQASTLTKQLRGNELSLIGKPIEDHSAIYIEGENRNDDAIYTFSPQPVNGSVIQKIDLNQNLIHFTSPNSESKLVPVKLDFDSLSDLKISSSRLRLNQVVVWHGYYNNGDGGGNNGVVKAGPHVHDGGHIISLSENKYIEASFDNYVYDLQFGVKLDYLYDSLPHRQAALDYAASAHKVTVLSAGTMQNGVLRIKHHQEVWDFATRLKPTRCPLSSGSAALRFQSNEKPEYKGGCFQHFDFAEDGKTRVFQERGARTGIGLDVFGDIANGSSIQAIVRGTMFEGFGVGGQYAGCFNSAFYDLSMKRNDIQTLMLNDTNNSIKFYNLRSNLDCEQHVIGDPVITGVGLPSSGATFINCEFENASKFPWLHVKSGTTAWYDIITPYSIENNDGEDPSSTYQAIQFDIAGRFHMVDGAINSAGKSDARLFKGSRGTGELPWDISINSCKLDSLRVSGFDFDVDYDMSKGDMLYVSPDSTYSNNAKPDNSICAPGVEMTLYKHNKVNGERMLWSMNAARMRLSGWDLDQRMQNTLGHLGLVHPNKQCWQAGGLVLHKANGDIAGHLFANDETGSLYYKKLGIATSIIDGELIA
ncbi:phage tail protein [Vibrio parahaemolyticus]